MAAYAATVTSGLKKALKIDNIVGIGVFCGKVDITNYNTTLVAIAAIRDKFKTNGILAVVAGTTEGGEWLEWLDASNSFKAYISNAVTGITEEVAIDVDVGEADFIAIGFV